MQNNLSEALAVGDRIDWRNVVALQDTTESFRVIMLTPAPDGRKPVLAYLSSDYVPFFLPSCGREMIRRTVASPSRPAQGSL
jgi:hypothetical protein